MRKQIIVGKVTSLEQLGLMIRSEDGLFLSYFVGLVIAALIIGLGFHFYESWGVLWMSSLLLGPFFSVEMGNKFSDWALTDFHRRCSSGELVIPIYGKRLP